ncbi:MAG: glycosyltransferase, partial [Acutalibacteraceae bacterium]|nr:glycosyltransferase [Acutalibacteraceae bacterium]
MSNTVVSVVIPYLEENNKIIDTLSSICKQKGFDSTKIEVLIIDTTENSSSKDAIGNLSICKIISTTSVKNEAEACNLAAENAVGDYITVCRCGDVFSNKYFKQCLKAFDEFENVPFVSVMRYCVHPVFKEPKAHRLNIPDSKENKPVNIEENPDFLCTEVFGTLFKTSVFKQYKINTNLKYEYFQDFMLRLQLDYPEYICAYQPEYNYRMPLEDDFLYYIPTNYKDWYEQSMREFLLELAKFSIEKSGTVPEFIQFYFIYAISTRFLANMNNRNKRNMSKEELTDFFEKARQVLHFVDNTHVLNSNKYKSLGFSEEAAEMFYM